VSTMPDPAMVLTFAVIALTIVLYAWERVPIEVISLGSVASLIVIFALFPATTPSGVALGPGDLLAGFANPALITILCLLVIGQALFHTDALETPGQMIADWGRRHGTIVLYVLLLGTGVLSALLNNTPVVVMALPVLTALAQAQSRSTSQILMPLSFITILGGMTTIIGSSTNLLVADVAAGSGVVTLDFFSFTPIGTTLALAGAGYALFIVPWLMRNRAAVTDTSRPSGKQFIAQIEIGPGHPLVGAKPVAGMFDELGDMTVRLILRGETPFLPPYASTTLAEGDRVVVAATRQQLRNALAEHRVFASQAMRPEARSPVDGDDLMLAEAVVAPGSRLIGRTIVQAGLQATICCVVLGIQRRSRMPRMAMSDIRLEAGDVLLLAGDHDDIETLRNSHDILIMEWSTADVPRRANAPRALAIFGAVVAAAASGLVPIVSAAIVGAFAMLASGCINTRQAMRALDSRIYMMVGASIANAAALDATGGARAIADGVVALMEGQPPLMLISGFFLLIAILTNLLSNNATAVLFTPIALGIAARGGLPAEPFVVAVILAANCSFATPIGYQTNLLVMGPGNYRFADFLIAGIPLVVLLWIVFTITVPLYYGL